MASKGTIGGRIVLEGEEKYRSALKNIKTEQSELRSEMRLCQTEFKNSQIPLRRCRQSMMFCQSKWTRRRKRLKSMKMH